MAALLRSGTRGRKWVISHRCIVIEIGYSRSSVLYYKLAILAMHLKNAVTPSYLDTKFGLIYIQIIYKRIAN